VEGSGEGREGGHGRGREGALGDQGFEKLRGELGRRCRCRSGDPSQPEEVEDGRGGPEALAEGEVGGEGGVKLRCGELERRLLVLATVGSAGPFVGLLGTVWGIMTSFRAIAGQQSTSLAVVAPGIAEALFATAIGLIAAIPATIFYNKFSSEVNKQAQRLEGFADEFSAILSRQIDERA
jgi:hypothetical protein